MRGPVFLLATFLRAWHTGGPQGLFVAWMNKSMVGSKNHVLKVFEQDRFPTPGSQQILDDVGSLREADQS